MENLMLVLNATGVVLMEILVVVAFGFLGAKIYVLLSPVIKKYEPAMKERAHEVARAINW